MKISVIIPTKDCAEYLRVCLNSLKLQEVRPYEVIIVDGNSNDNTAGVAEDCGLNVRYYRRAAKGQADAVTFGLTVAVGDVLHWHAADDLFLPEALATVSRHFSTGERNLLLFSDGTAFDERRYFRMATYRWNTFRAMYSCPHPLMRLQSDCVYWSRELSAAGLPLDASMEICCDENFFLRLCAEARMVWSSARLGAFRMRAGQLSQALDRRHVSDYRRKMRDALRDAFPGDKRFRRPGFVESGWSRASVCGRIRLNQMLRLFVKSVTFGRLRKDEEKAFRVWLKRAEECESPGARKDSVVSG